MLGTTGNGDMTPKRPQEEPRPSSVPASHLPNQFSPQQHDRNARDAGFRASSQPPIPVLHEPARFFTPQQHDPMYNGHNPNQYQVQSRLPNHNLNGPTPHSQAAQYHLHNQPVSNHGNFTSPSLLELERERERENEEERRHKEREKERDRERERFDGARTPIGRYEPRLESSSRRGSSHTHGHSVPHHHHHVHHVQPTFKQPKLIISSQRVFEEARLYLERKLGRWTYNPTERPPFDFLVNSVLVVHVPRRFLHPENNSALKRRRLWGTEIYTDDSDLAAILIHSTPNIPPTGDLEMTVRIMPCLVKYKSSMSNDLRSRGWLTKHDGHSFYVEKIIGVSWRKEISGKGFAKRCIDEMHYLARESVLASVKTDNWHPQKFRKSDSSLSTSPPPMRPLNSGQQAVIAAAPENSERDLFKTRVDEEYENGKVDKVDEGDEGDDTIELIDAEHSTDADADLAQIAHQELPVLRQSEKPPSNSAGSPSGVVDQLQVEIPELSSRQVLSGPVMPASDAPLESRMFDKGPSPVAELYGTYQDDVNAEMRSVTNVPANTLGETPDVLDAASNSNERENGHSLETSITTSAIPNVKVED